MKRKDWTVGDYSVRPGGRPGGCTYCKTAIGKQHSPGCVVRERTLVADVTIRMVMTVPEHWNSSDFEFSRNEGSWCQDNIIDLLQDQSERMGCLCAHNTTKVEYVREATEEDEEIFGLKVADSES